MNTEFDPDNLYRYITTHWDLQGYSRAEWRALSRGHQRPRLRDSLVQLAETAVSGARSDRLALYKAAHATLPLHGRPLLDFVRLLAEERPAPMEWTDAFLILLAERPSGYAALQGAILASLEQICTQPMGSRGTQCKVKSIYAHVRLLGYRPDWLPPDLEDAVPNTASVPLARETTTKEVELRVSDDDPLRMKAQEPEAFLPHLDI